MTPRTKRRDAPSAATAARWLRGLAAGLALATGCRDRAERDAGLDDASDANLDAAVDAGLDDAVDAGTRTFHCALDPSCPEVLVEGDPPATNPFRGYGDPSLELDPNTGALWLAYSWLEAVVIDASGEPDLTVVTHLARSDDAGRHFTYVRGVNATGVVAAPDGEGDGLWFHEVPTLAATAEGFRLVTLDYLDPVGVGERRLLHFAETHASTPAALGDVTTPWLGPRAALASIPVAYDLASIAGLEDCATLTEPALVRFEGVDYLAASCVVVDGEGRHPERERIELLRVTSDGFTRIGPLFDARDAAALGAGRLEQIDLAVARDGAVIALVTPIVDDGEPLHRGCIAYEVSSLAEARVRRDAEGHAVPRVTITADGTVLGPGLCTYDAASETGVLLVITDFDLTLSPPRLRFSLRATGVHP